MNFKYSLIAYGLIDSARSPRRGYKNIIMAEKKVEKPCASRDMVSHRKSSKNHYRTEKTHTFLPTVSESSLCYLDSSFISQQKLDRGWTTRDYLHGKHNEGKTLFNLHFCHNVLWVGEHKKLPASNRMNKLLYSHTMECSTAMKMNNL